MPRGNQIEIISDTLREQILAGAFQPYNVLPQRKDLAAQFQTTPDTIAKALLTLQAEGLVTFAGGRTVRVNSIRERVTTLDETFRDYMRARGKDVAVEHISQPGHVPMTAEVAKVFQEPVGTQVIERARREIVDGIIYRYSKKYYPASLVNEQTLQAMQEDKAFNFRDVLKGQKPITDIHEEYIARGVTTREEIDILGVAKGTPVLQITRANYAADQSTVLYAKVVLIGAFFVKTLDYKIEQEPQSGEPL